MAGFFDVIDVCTCSVRRMFYLRMKQNFTKTKVHDKSACVIEYCMCTFQLRCVVRKII